MKFLTLAILVLTSFGINAQIKPKTITNPDGSKSLGWEIGKPKTTITAQGSFSYPNGVVPEPISSKSGANKKNYILVVNESDAKSAKFEISIFSGNKSLSKATLMVQISANSFTPKLLGNGQYNYSDKSPADRLKYEFSGTVKLGNTDVPISAGWFTVERAKKQIEIKFDLTLSNGVKTTGQYITVFQTENRSQIAL
jgi:hypothetical protein